MRMVTEGDVKEALRACIGSPVADNSPRMMQECAGIMNARQRESLEQVAEALEHAIFMGLYDALGDSMTLRRDDGSIVRIYLNMLPDVADLALFALLDTMDVYRMNFNLIKEYYMASGSLSALIVLQRKYATFQEDDENKRQYNALLERLGPEACERLLSRH